MHSAAMTIHIAFTGSPRFSAMMPSATAPSTATATHSNFLGINMVRSYGSCARPQPPIPRLCAEALKPLCFDPPSATGETLARNLSPRHSGNRGGVRALGLTGLARGGQFPGVGGAPVRGGLQGASALDDRKPRGRRMVSGECAAVRLRSARAPAGLGRVVDVHVLRDLLPVARQHESHALTVRGLRRTDRQRG